MPSRAARIAVSTLLLAAWCRPVHAWDLDDDKAGSNKDPGLKSLSLEQLGNVEVTSVSKAPEQVWKTPAAIFVITQEDIRRSGATSVPELLRLAPGVQVARIDADRYVREPVEFGEFIQAIKQLGLYWLLLSQSAPIPRDL